MRLSLKPLPVLATYDFLGKNTYRFPFQKFVEIKLLFV
jgi:hypothetical protein